MRRALQCSSYSLRLAGALVATGFALVVSAASLRAQSASDHLHPQAAAIGAPLLTSRFAARTGPPVLLLPSSLPVPASPAAMCDRTRAAHTTIAAAGGAGLVFALSLPVMLIYGLSRYGKQERTSFPILAVMAGGGAVFGYLAHREWGRRCG